MTRAAHSSTACTEFAEQEVLDRIQQRRLDADLRRAAVGGDRLEAVGRRRLRPPALAGGARAGAMIARLRARLDRSARPESPIHEALPTHIGAETVSRRGGRRT